MNKTHIIHKTILLVIFFLKFSDLHSQNWPKVYYDDISAAPYALLENYDRGYIYAGGIYDGALPYLGFILKTGINGVVLWDKKIGEQSFRTSLHDIIQANDYGLIIIGSTRKLDPMSDPYLMKLNECGEKEWCRILHLPNNSDYGIRVTQLPNGNILALLSYYSYISSERISLMCFDETGNILWLKVYAQTKPDIIYEDGFSLLLTADSSILITARGAFPDSGTMDYKYRPLLIKTDFNGEEKWTLPWGYTLGFRGHGVRSVEDKEGNIYTAGRNEVNFSGTGYTSTLIKTSRYGKEIFHSDFHDSTTLGLATTVSWLEDSTLAVGCGWKYPGYEEVIYHGIAKVQTNGKVDTIKTLIEADNTFSGSITTFDKKVVIVGGFYFGGNWDVYAYKFNKDLEFDSIYNQPFVYDSLCPYPIESDTIPLDCVIVGIGEDMQSEKSELVIAPNPATNYITIKLPEYIVTRSNRPGFNVNTWRYQYKDDVIIEIFDLMGKKWKEATIPQGQTEIELQFGSLPNGLYIVRCNIEGSLVSGRFLVVK